MLNGWIKLHRGLLEWEWYSDANTCRLFIHCLLRANHADKVWQGKLIKRGSFFTSLDSLAKETGLTNKQIRLSLDKLNSTGELAGSGQARGRMITVINYDSYQDEGRPEGREKAGLGQAEGNKQECKKERIKNIQSSDDDQPAKSLATQELLSQITQYWNDSMQGIAPKIDLLKKNKANVKRIKLIEEIIKTDWTDEQFDTDYRNHEYWAGYISRLATSDKFQWQRENNQLCFDQAMNFSKFERNLGLMRMEATR
jgi:hypothetical protein